ncbi:MAG: 2-dehydropantoate 2-reductase [Gemmatimonadaceae bacterium]|nr:2-dehydropantoate 2-reductase [Gemmatimonadaceae bacterium]
MMTGPVGPSTTSDATATRDRLRVAVVGVGGVGGVFGARLAQHGHDVGFVARGATLAALRENGLRLDSVDGDVHLPSVHATEDAASLGTVDVVFVAVKATQIVRVAPSLHALIGEHTLVVPLQNGVEAATLLTDVLPPEAVLEGLCRVMAMQAGPGHIKHTAVTPVLEIGPRAGATLTDARKQTLERFVAAIRDAGMHPIVPPDMAVAIWEKFLFIEPLGAVCAAAHFTIGPVRSTPETRALVDQALDEVVAVGRAAGVNWPAEAKAQVWQRYDALPAEGSTSMARDLMARRPSEFDAQTGAVIRLARRYAVPVPVHDVLHAVLLPASTPAT